jgi:hypothetical protein
MAPDLAPGTRGQNGLRSLIDVGSSVHTFLQSSKNLKGASNDIFNMGHKLYQSIGVPVRVCCWNIFFKF